ncbi:MAG: hypothetical protein V8R80_06040 [Eubacterium sp.]
MCRDARVIHLHITQKGRDALEERKKTEKQIGVDFCSCLSPEEQQMFIEMCDRLSDNLTAIKEADEIRRKEIMKSIS